MFPLLVTLALAEDATCVACCKAGGLEGCPTTLKIRTEKSGVDAYGLSWDLQGAWVLACDGTGRFDPTETASLDHEPGYAEVIASGSNPLALHCFVEACALPEGVCVGQANLNGDVQLVGCEDALAVDQKDLARAPKHHPGAGAMVVVIDGRPIVAEKTEGNAAQPAAAPTIPAPAYDPYRAPAALPTPAYDPYRAPTPVVTTTVPPPAWPDSPPPVYDPYAPVSAPTYTPAPAPSTAPAPAWTPAPDAPPPPAASIVLELPPDPPDPCSPASDAMRGESRKRVGTGDDFRMANRLVDALKDYRAALTMDKCNGYAWMSIAQIAADQGRTDLAVRALRNTTLLLPVHPGGWLMLGRAYEAIGQRSLAGEAYKKATEIAPGNAEAVEGYMRTR